ncbi:uncharacterized protein C9orf152 homolog [Sorex fumeus]|uniref:uncharacterized protein C9orf152 homolog n=1 Tax=Sorex fumeus TaxID=62283 RepID=UPI0024AE752F|nr:uncharacterized protein C9orf152 homolog [Sorex fumeus]
MKGSPCPCPALPNFWLLGSRFMAEGPGTPALGNGPRLSIPLLRAQYEGQRRQQRAQVHMVVLPTGSRAPAPGESMVSAVWINKERRLSLPPEEGHPEADRACPQMPGSPWRTHLEMHRFAQAFLQEANHEAQHQDPLTGSEPRPPQHGAPRREHPRVTEQGTKTHEAAQSTCQVDGPPAEAEGSGLHLGLQCLPSLRTAPRSGKPAHYPFPQRKAPRISQAARNLGLYGPV